MKFRVFITEVVTTEYIVEANDTESAEAAATELNVEGAAYESQSVREREYEVIPC